MKELLCARFQNPEGADCLAIWLPDGTCATMEAAMVELELHKQHFAFPVVLVGRLDDGQFIMLGEPDLVKQVESLGPDSLDWRITPFI